MVAADSVVAVEVETAEDVVASEAAEEVSEVETAVVVEASEVEIAAVAVASEVDAEDSGESHYRSIFFVFFTDFFHSIIHSVSAVLLEAEEIVDVAEEDLREEVAAAVEVEE